MSSSLTLRGAALDPSAAHPAAVRCRRPGSVWWASGSLGHCRRYAFLVYNASVYLWNICRPLLRVGAARHLVDSYEAICTALGTVDDPRHAWRVQTLLNFARCLDDTGRTDDVRARPTLAHPATARHSSSSDDGKPAIHSDITR